MIVANRLLSWPSRTGKLLRTCSKASINWVWWSTYRSTSAILVDLTCWKKGLFSSFLVPLVGSRQRLFPVVLCSMMLLSSLSWICLLSASSLLCNDKLSCVSSLLGGTSSFGMQAFLTRVSLSFHCLSLIRSSSSARYLSESGINRWPFNLDWICIYRYHSTRWEFTVLPSDIR